MLRRLMLKLSDPTKDGTLSNKFRLRRFELFKDVAGHLLDEPVSILDLGGMVFFWERMGFCNNDNIQITMVNLTAEPSKYPNIKSTAGTACDLSQFADSSFDIVFSNSVIEHVGDFEDQKCMANEVRRVGKRYFVQTPNYYFPMEPHYLVIGWQFMPVRVRMFLLKHFHIAKCNKISDRKWAREIAEGVRLLKKSELKKLFPNAHQYIEKAFGLTKSFVLYEGFDTDKT